MSSMGTRSTSASSRRSRHCFDSASANSASSAEISRRYMLRPLPWQYSRSQFQYSRRHAAGKWLSFPGHFGQDGVPAGHWPLMWPSFPHLWQWPSNEYGVTLIDDGIWPFGGLNRRGAGCGHFCWFCWCFGWLGCKRFCCFAWAAFTSPFCLGCSPMWHIEFSTYLLSISSAICAKVGRVPSFSPSVLASSEILRLIC